MQDKDLVEQVLKQIEVLKQFMSTDIEELNAILAEIGQPMTDARMAMLSRRMDEIIESLEDIYATFSVLAVPEAFTQGKKFAAEILGIKRISQSKEVDEKAIKKLIADMNHDFSTTLANGEKRAIFVMKQFSKQGKLTEADISMYVAKGYIDTNTGMGAKKLLRAAITEDNNGILDESELGRSIKRRIAKAKKDISEITVNEELRARLLQEEVQKLNDGKFMQIINKNGKIMTFKVDTYADLVSRTRLGDSQVAGTIEEASKYNIDTFRVSDHNTKSEICQEHENKIYTTDRDNRKFLLLTETRRPLYHVNCQHRLLPRKFTSTELEGMANIR